jgi:hypothetical protein
MTWKAEHRLMSPQLKTISPCPGIHHWKDFSASVSTANQLELGILVEPKLQAKLKEFIHVIIYRNTFDPAAKW